MLLGLKLGRPLFEGLSLLTRTVPRTNYLLDIGLDWVRQRPGPSQAVLEGLLLGETAPHREERVKIEHQTLVVGHPRDPLHPFSDSGMLLEELPNSRLVEANSILEWRLDPGAAERRAERLPRGSLDPDRCAPWRLAEAAVRLTGS